ncbi:hypothetical protein [Nonomuraea sp. NPDC003804]|uniref:hypothetical protein n=1 Tax=Nonomuraea sp. NPDC003804 TaxID=3154547 RepID=UPI0033A918E2
MIDLLDVLKDVAHVTDYTTACASVASRTVTDPAVVHRRLLLCLYGLGTNVGITQRTAVDDDAMGTGRCDPPPFPPNGRQDDGALVGRGFVRGVVAGHAPASRIVMTSSATAAGRSPRGSTNWRPPVSYRTWVPLSRTVVSRIPRWAAAAFTRFQLGACRCRTCAVTRWDRVPRLQRHDRRMGLLARPHPVGDGVDPATAGQGRAPVEHLVAAVLGPVLGFVSWAAQESVGADVDG